MFSRRESAPDIQVSPTKTAGRKGVLTFRLNDCFFVAIDCFATAAKVSFPPILLKN
jgi:hypothetical protein